MGALPPRSTKASSRPTGVEAGVSSLRRRRSPGAHTSARTQALSIPTISLKAPTTNTTIASHLTAERRLDAIRRAPNCAPVHHLLHTGLCEMLGNVEPPETAAGPKKEVIQEKGSRGQPSASQWTTRALIDFPLYAIRKLARRCFCTSSAQSGDNNVEPPDKVLQATKPIRSRGQSRAQAVPTR